MSFELVPFFDDDDWMLSPSWAHPRQRRLSDLLFPSRDDSWGLNHWSHDHPRSRMAQLVRDVDNLKRDAFNSGIVPRDDAFEVALDVNGFDPKELQVNVHDNYLTMSGRHEEKSPDGTSYVSRSFTRKYHLPESVNQDEMKSNLTSDGKTLRIMAPLRSVKGPESKAIPIEINRDKPTAIEHKKG